MFTEGHDYQTINQKVEREIGSTTVIKYMLTTSCLEYFIAKKVRPVFDVYRNEITFQLGNGDTMINLTEVARSFPNKNLTNILNSKELIEYLQVLENKSDSKLQICSFSESQYITVKKGAPNTGGGTWVHQRVALRVAQKLSPDFSVWVDEKLEELLTTGKSTITPILKLRVKKIGVCPKNYRSAPHKKTE